MPDVGTAHGRSDWNASSPLRRTVTMTCTAALLLAGCGGLHLHNPADEALARKASDAFKAADVTEFIASERKILAATQERDLSTTRRNVLAERDTAMIVALSEGRTAGDLTGYIKGRLAAIGIPDSDSTRKLLHRLPDQRRQMLVARDAYIVAVSATNTAPPAIPPSDEDFKAAQATGDGNIVAIFLNYQTAASTYQKDLQTLNSLTAGQLGSINARLAEAGELERDIRKELAAKKAELDKLVSAYKAAEKERASTADALRNQIKEALDTFDVTQQVVNRAKAVGLEDLLAEARLAKLVEIRTQLSDFLTAFSRRESGAGGTGGSGRSEAEVAGRTAAVLAGASDMIREASTRAKLVPLVFEQERVRIEIIRAERVLERGKKRVELFARQRDALLSEATRLVDASNSLDTSSGKDPKKLVQDLLGTTAAKGPLVHALLVWSESIAIDKLREEEIEVALISLDHEQALDASEFALALWKHMIATPLEELVGYHASGIKSQDIANLINAVGLAGIAIGVNR